MPALLLATSETTVDMTNILSGCTDLLSWVLTSMSSLTAWILGDSLAFLYAAMFITGFAVAFLFRILRSV